MGPAIKHRVEPSIVIFWHPGTLTLRAERQSARMSKITIDGSNRSGTGCLAIVGIKRLIFRLMFKSAVLASCSTVFRCRFKWDTTYIERWLWRPRQTDRQSERRASELTNRRVTDYRAPLECCGLVCKLAETVDPRFCGCWLTTLLTSSCWQQLIDDAVLLTLNTSPFRVNYPTVIHTNNNLHTTLSLYY